MEILLVVKISVAKLMKIKKHFQLCGILRVRNPDVKQHIFRKKTCFWLDTTKIGLFSDFKQSANGTLLYTPSKMLSYMVTFFTKFLRLKISRHAVSLPFYLPSPTAQFFNFAKWRH